MLLSYPNILELDFIVEGYCVRTNNLIYKFKKTINTTLSTIKPFYERISFLYNFVVHIVDDSRKTLLNFYLFTLTNDSYYCQFDHNLLIFIRRQKVLYKLIKLNVIILLSDLLKNKRNV